MAATVVIVRSCSSKEVAVRVATTALPIDRRISSDRSLADVQEDVRLLSRCGS